MDTQSELQIPEDSQMQATGQQEEASTSGRSDIELLRAAVLNEKAAPELLHYEADLIGRIEQLIDYQVRAAPARCRRALECTARLPHLRPH